MIDKDLYRKAFDQYRQWNEAELRQRIRNAGQRTPQQGWEAYLDLWNFSQKLGAKASPYQQRQKLQSLEAYYSRVRKWKPGERLMEGKLELALHTAIAFLESHAYPYAIIGGIALAQWGLPRLTQDVDIKVLVPNLEYSLARSSIQSAFPESARAITDSLIVAVKIAGVTVDFLMALPGYEESMIKRSIQIEFDGSPVWVCTAEDLIIQKVVANREKDWLDVENVLIEQSGRLDQVYIREWLAQFAEALEDAELLLKYGRLIGKVEGYQ